MAGLLVTVADSQIRQGETRGEFRLRVLNSLPDLHQRYLYDEVQKRCSRFLRMRRVGNSEVSLSELLSEVWRKLLGSLSIQDSMTRYPFEETSIHPHAPDRDGRVVWLIEEIGGSDALAHRLEDIMRQRYGRAIPEGGRPIVQADDFDDLSEGTLDPPVEVEDNNALIWRGLVGLAQDRFRPDDDVAILLQLLATTAELFEDSVGGQWPINRILSELNVRFPEPAWRVDRVDNAKRRLLGWISRVKKNNGLDQTDFEALLVLIAKRSGVARQGGKPHPRSNALS